MQHWVEMDQCEFSNFICAREYVLLNDEICPIKFQTRKQVITPTLRADLYT